MIVHQVSFCNFTVFFLIKLKTIVINTKSHEQIPKTRAPITTHYLDKVICNTHAYNNNNMSVSLTYGSVVVTCKYDIAFIRKIRYHILSHLLKSHLLAEMLLQLVSMILISSKKLDTTYYHTYNINMQVSLTYGSVVVTCKYDITCI